MEKSTPSACIPKWRSTFRNAYITNVDGNPIHNLDDLRKAIKEARQAKQIQLHITFATEQKHGINPVDGNLTMYFDQLNACTKLIQAADTEARQQQNSTDTYKNDPVICHTTANPPTNSSDPDLGKLFTKKQLMN